MTTSICKARLGLFALVLVAAPVMAGGSASAGASVRIVESAKLLSIANTIRLSGAESGQPYLLHPIEKWSPRRVDSFLEVVGEADGVRLIPDSGVRVLRLPLAAGTDGDLLPLGMTLHNY
jgi:hypothetical protein